MKRLRQLDFFRKVLRIEWFELTQLLNHFFGDQCRLAILRSAMHHAMPHRGQRITPAVLLDPIHQGADGRHVVRRGNLPREGFHLAEAIHAQGRLRQSNPLNSALQNPSE
jgi:hypothetical protein